VVKTSIQVKQALLSGQMLGHLPVKVPLPLVHNPAATLLLGLPVCWKT